MTEQTAIAKTDPLPAAVPVPAGFFDTQSFELMYRVSKAFSTSTLVPKDFQGNPANCMIALNLAKRLGADPLMVMQNLNIVHGRPSWSSQFLIATVNQCGRFSALRFEFFGQPGTDGYGCRARATEKITGECLVGADISIGIAKAEGWYSRNGSKWKTMPQQMLMYRSGAWWTRAYAPELSMGLPTSDELRDMGEIVSQPAATGVDLRPVLTEVQAPQPPPSAETDDQQRVDANAPTE